MDYNLGGNNVDDNLGGEDKSKFLSSDSDIGNIPSEYGTDIDGELTSLK